MNVINRLLVVMLLMFVLVASCSAFVVMLFARNSISTTLQPTLASISDPAQNLPLLFCLGLTLITAVFAVLLLYLELMPGGKTRLKLKSIQGADVTMTSDAITQQLTYAIEPLPGVIRATPKVTRGKNDTIDVLVELVTTPDVDVKRKTDEVLDMTRTVLEGGLGLRVGQTKIKIEQMQAPKKGAPSIPTSSLPRLVSDKQEQANENAT